MKRTEFIELIKILRPILTPQTGREYGMTIITSGFKIVTYHPPKLWNDKKIYNIDKSESIGDFIKNNYDLIKDHKDAPKIVAYLFAEDGPYSNKWDLELAHSSSG